MSEIHHLISWRKNCETWFGVANYELPSYLPAILRITSATFLRKLSGDTTSTSEPRDNISCIRSHVGRI